MLPRMVEYLTSPSGCRFAIRINKNPFLTEVNLKTSVSMLSQFLWWSNCSMASQRTGYLPDHSERYEALFQFFYSPSVSWAPAPFIDSKYTGPGGPGNWTILTSKISDKHELRLIVAQAKILFVNNEKALLGLLIKIL